MRGLAGDALAAALPHRRTAVAAGCRADPAERWPPLPLPLTLPPAGFGFVEMESEDAAAAAIRALDQGDWNGRRLLVEVAKRPR